jgi:hypothetical protein
MLVGFNYPWSYTRVGADIGPNPHVSVDPVTKVDPWARDQKLALEGKLDQIPLPPLFDKLASNLEHLAHLGISVVRFWLLGNGFNYGPAPTPRSGGWTFTPPAKADPRFKRDFAALLAAFAKAKMQIIPSLISFEFAGPLDRNRPVNGCLAGGRADCITDPATRKVFLSTLLADLLEASKGYGETIRCWEVINEPYWDSSNFWPAGSTIILAAPPILSQPPSISVPFTVWQPQVSRDAMVKFLEQALDQIHTAGFKSTVGHRFYNDLTRYPTGDFKQFHYYAKNLLIDRDPDPLSPGLFQGSPKPIVGEFDSDFNLHSNPWPALAGKDTTYNRLQLLQNLGCELALIWPDRPSDDSDDAVIRRDDPVKLQGPTREAIARFTGGTVDPKTW